MIENLKKFGLTEKESCVYLALIELGPSSVSEITHKANLNRTTGYDILERLVAKKIVSIAKKRGKIIYAAEEPAKFIKFIENKKRLWDDRLEEARGLLPELKSIYNIKGIKPKIRFYTGREGLIEVYEDSLNSSENIRAITSAEHLKEILGDYTVGYVKRRVQKGITIRTIMPFSKYGLYLKNTAKKQLREVRLMPPEKFNISLESYVYDRKVSYFSLKEKFAVIIESQEIAQAQKKLWDLAWEKAKEYYQIEKKKLKSNKGQ